MQSPLARILVWIFNIAGTLDLALAIVLATLYDATAEGRPTGFAFWVPALIW